MIPQNTHNFKMDNIPKQIKDVFVINDQIGRGSFGDVYKATMKNRKQVAIKFEPKNASKKCLKEEIEVSST